jgi:hypothetical protein
MAGGFQTSVALTPAIGVEGDFYSTNPRFSVTAGSGGLVAGPSGAIVGRFCWAVAPDDADGTPAIVNSFGSGPVTGFLAREQQGLITTFLSDASLRVPAGFPLGLMSGCDVLVKNRGTTQALPGMTAYANFADGGVTFAAAGNPTGATATAWAIAATSAALSCTGSIAGAVLTVTAVSTGSVYPGTIITNAGPTIAVGTQVVSQLTSTASGGALNSTGTYALSIPEQTIASGTITGTSGTLTLTTVSTGVFAVGDTLTGATAGVTAGTAITYGPLTGTGASGSTFIVSPSQSSSNSGQGNLTAALNVATKWVAMSSGLANELVKISSHVQG